MAGRGRVLRRLNEDNPISAVETGISSESQGTAVKLLAKYSYKANRTRPGGFDEIDIKQGEYVWLVRKGHGDNHLWWEIERENGMRGHAPAQYLMEVETNVASLPWLNEDKAPDTVPSGNKSECPKFKSYVSAYDCSKPKKEDDYYCKICERSFNGPIPFRAHNNSKAHKEEVELAKRSYKGE